MRVLVVTNPFKGREIGERITDPAEMQEVLAGEYADRVVQAEHAEPAKTKSKEA